MSKTEKPLLSRADIRRMQEIEGNPLTPEDEAMLDIFEREGWGAERRLQYIRDDFEKRRTSFET